MEASDDVCNTLSTGLGSSALALLVSVGDLDDGHVGILTSLDSTGTQLYVRYRTKVTPAAIISYREVISMGDSFIVSCCLPSNTRINSDSSGLS